MQLVPGPCTLSFRFALIQTYCLAVQTTVLRENAGAPSKTNKLYFLFRYFVLEKEKADKTFGFSFLSLMRADGTTVPDGSHELCVYKVSLCRVLIL